LMLQDKVYNFTTQKWLLDDIHAEYGWLLYKGIKVALASFALFIIFALIASLQQPFTSLKKSPRLCLYIVKYDSLSAYCQRR
ncbi:MAG: hypothetical protein ACRDBM_01655, partial [Sporomusa sp.]